MNKTYSTVETNRGSRCSRHYHTILLLLLKFYKGSKVQSWTWFQLRCITCNTRRALVYLLFNSLHVVFLLSLIPYINVTINSDAELLTPLINNLAIILCNHMLATIWPWMLKQNSLSNNMTSHPKIIIKISVHAGNSYGIVHNF